MPSCVRFFLFVMLFTTSSGSLAQTVAGKVMDKQAKPLDFANVMAIETTGSTPPMFSTTSADGKYTFELDNTKSYEIRVSYIGFIGQTHLLEAGFQSMSHNFVLESSGELLDEIVIAHAKPVDVRKDTITFNVASFANGTELKMKEILEKLPGVEVGKNGTVTVNGKTVTQLLVEGNLFFGGGSKLAVENIPADALDKIEIIDHFSQDGFMKQVSDSEELALNVKLKEDKKDFVFGDVRTNEKNDGFVVGCPFQAVLDPECQSPPLF